MARPSSLVTAAAQHFGRRQHAAWRLGRLLALPLVSLALVAACAAPSGRRGVGLIAGAGQPPTTLIPVQPADGTGLRLRPIKPTVDTAARPTTVAAIGQPLVLVISAIGVRAPLIPLALGQGNVMQVPARFDEAGWYTGGPQPGEVGPAVIAGHVDSYTGPAVFFRLKDLKAGDVIDVIGSVGVVQYRVETIGRFSKSQFPVQSVFGPTPDHALRLITCGGTFDRSVGSYRDNVVVFASQTTASGGAIR